MPLRVRLHFERQRTSPFVLEIIKVACLQNCDCSLRCCCFHEDHDATNKSPNHQPDQRQPRTSNGFITNH
ncbi:hypothetical protein VTI74DRAFT_4864 [Chaetomium olivicolor]